MGGSTNRQNTGDDASHVCFSEKQRTNISTDCSGMAPSSTYRLHIGTGFQYPTLTTTSYFPGF